MVTDGMNDYSTVVTATPVQVVPDAGAGRRSLILFAPGSSNASGGNGDIVYSFTLTGAAVVPGAPGTLYLAGGQSITYGGQPSGYAPPNAVWAVAVRGTAAPITALTT